jgi:hypothetical protein
MDETVCNDFELCQQEWIGVTVRDADRTAEHDQEICIKAGGRARHWPAVRLGEHSLLCCSLDGGGSRSPSRTCIAGLW